MTQQTDKEKLELVREMVEKMADETNCLVENSCEDDVCRLCYFQKRAIIQLLLLDKRLAIIVKDDIPEVPNFQYDDDVVRPAKVAGCNAYTKMLGDYKKVIPLAHILNELLKEMK